MNSFFFRFPRLRAAATKLGSLVLLFQRAPVIKMLFPEARVLAGAGIGELTKWTVATFAGLGAYDTVAGATTNVTQIAPAAGSLTVPAAVGSSLSFSVHTTGNFTNSQAWTITGTVPAGLVTTDPRGSAALVDTISGIPTTTGTSSITMVAWQNSNKTGFSSPPQTYSIVVGSAIITTQPASTSISSGGTTVLTVVADKGAGTALAYQWFKGTSPSTTTTISGATTASLTTPAATAAASYWVRVTRAVTVPTTGSVNIIANSATATVSISTGTPPAITTSPASTTINSGSTATLTVATSGTTPTFQWYEGATGITTTPIAGATAASFTTPALTATTSYWVRATNTAGTADSAAAVVTVTQPDPVAEWKASLFTAGQLADPLVSGDSADPDGDGVSNSAEYIFGTSPLVNDPAPLVLAAPTDQVALSFTAKLATGAGYTGKTRHYALQSRTDLGTGDWSPVTGFEDIVGNDQVVTFSAPRAEIRTFYRLSVSLTP